MFERMGKYELAPQGYRRIDGMGRQRGASPLQDGRFELQGRFDEAVSFHVRAIEREPDNPECYYRLGVAFTKSRRYGDAEKMYRQAIATDPTHSKSYTNLGYILDLSGAAAPRFSSSARWCSTIPATPRLISTSERSTGKKGQGAGDQGIEEIGLEIDPSSVEGHYNLGLALVDEKMLDDAAGEFRKILKLESDNVNALFYLGFIYYRKGVYGKSLRYLEQAARLNLGNATILYYVGECFNRLEQPQKAIEYFKKVTEINPDDSKVHFGLGISYEKQDDKRKARECYRMAAGVSQETAPGQGQPADDDPHIDPRSRFVAAALILQVPSPVLSFDETIPPRSWVYPALRSFGVLGLVDLEPVSPYTRSEVESCVDRILESVSAGGVQLTPRQEFLLGKAEGRVPGDGGYSPWDRENGPLWALREGNRFFTIDLAAGRALVKRFEYDDGEANGLMIPTFLLGDGENSHLL